MPEKIHSSLQSLLPRVPSGGRVVPFSLYSPPASLPMPPMRELRTTHRTWLNPSSLGHAAAERPMPQPFLTPPSPAAASEPTLVLLPIDPMGYAKKAAAGGAAADPSSRPPKLDVERHPAAGTVVARKMLQRVRDDVAWLVSPAAQAALVVPRLQGFEDDGAGGARPMPSGTELQSRERAVSRLSGTLEALYKQDMEASEAMLPHVQALIIEGGTGAPDARRRARALAFFAGCELTPSLEMLCALMMSAHAEAEVKVLNPLLSDAEVARVLHDLTALLLTISRTQLVSKALVLCRKLQSTLAGLLPIAQKGGTPPPAAQHALADGQALADQLAAMLLTKRAHVKLGGEAPAGAVGAATSLAAFDPRILVFEFCASVVLRPAQVALLAKLVGHARGGGSVCHQMLMGEGKTTVISPLLALVLADGSQLLMQVVPAPLLRFTLQVMRSVFRVGPLRKPVRTFTFDRRTDVTEDLLMAASLAVDEGAVMVSTPAAVKAFMLKLLELLHLLDIGHYPRMHSALGRTVRKMLRIKMNVGLENALDKPVLLDQCGRAVQLMQLWRGAVAVIDEVDIVLHPLRSELNWPLGDRHPATCRRTERLPMPPARPPAADTSARPLATPWPLTVPGSASRSCIAGRLRADALGDAVALAGCGAPGVRAHQVRVVNRTGSEQPDQWRHHLRQGAHSRPPAGRSPQGGAGPQPAAARAASHAPLGRLLRALAQAHPRRLASALAAQAGPARCHRRAGVALPLGRRCRRDGAGRPD